MGATRRRGTAMGSSLGQGEHLDHTGLQEAVHVWAHIPGLIGQILPFCTGRHSLFAWTFAFPVCIASGEGEKGNVSYILRLCLLPFTTLLPPVRSIELRKTTTTNSPSCIVTLQRRSPVAQGDRSPWPLKPPGLAQS